MDLSTGCFSPHGTQLSTVLPSSHCLFLIFSRLKSRAVWFSSLLLWRLHPLQQRVDFQRISFNKALSPCIRRILGTAANSIVTVSHIKVDGHLHNAARNCLTCTVQTRSLGETYIWFHFQQRESIVKHLKAQFWVKGPEFSLKTFGGASLFH